tara:strand:- start:1076 stop:3190 length:2115 start_codon:yes stop_codon:yes gene_type:complete
MASILDNLKNAFTPTQEEKDVGSMVGYYGVGATRSRKYSYEQLSEEGFQKNAIVYRCISEIAKGASAVPYMLKAGDSVFERHPLLSLIDRPNPLQSHSEFFEAIFSYLLLSGNCYILKVGADIGSPKELHLLRPDRIKIKGSGKPIPESYEYVINGRTQAVYPIDETTGNSDIKQIKLFNPLDDYYGMSPMSPAAIEIDQHNMSGNHNINLLSNGARPSGAVVFKPQDDQGFSVNLSESQRQQMLSDINNRFSGTQNSGRIALLEGDFDFIEMGLSPKDMDFLNLKHMAATDIAMCFGVPSQLVGVPDAQTYANVAEARLALYEETIIPHLRKIESDINEWLAPMFGENLMFCFDIDKIPALAERTRRIYENVNGAVAQGIMTRNEAREAIGLSPIEGADDLYIPATLFPIGSESPEPVEKPTDDEELRAYEDYDLKETNFPKAGDDKKISLRNSNYPQFDYTFAKNVKEVGVGKQIWKAGGNIRGNDAFILWGRAREGSETPAVLDWIKEREAWAARHFRDGRAFAGGEEPNLSNVAGVVAQMKWGVIGNLGEQGMKDVILELTKKLEGKKDPDDKFIDDYWFHYADGHIDIGYGNAPIFLDDKQVSAKVKAALQSKVDKHNEKHGKNKSKRVTLRMLEAVFKRGVGAYRTNPSSVRPRVTGPDQWAYARVNAFLSAVRTGRFQGGKFDLDLLPKGHPLSSKK